MQYLYYASAALALLLAALYFFAPSKLKAPVSSTDQLSEEEIELIRASRLKRFGGASAPQPAHRQREGSTEPAHTAPAPSSRLATQAAYLAASTQPAAAAAAVQASAAQQGSQQPAALVAAALSSQQPAAATAAVPVLSAQHGSQKPVAAAAAAAADGAAAAQQGSQQPPAAAPLSDEQILDKYLTERNYGGGLPGHVSERTKELRRRQMAEAQKSLYSSPY
jgi:hypothetical protein